MIKLVAQLEVGVCPPTVEATLEPFVNRLGQNINVKLEYQGGMSATILPWTQRDLMLKIEVHEVEGVLSMIMPPSSDRLWFGFCEQPRLVMEAKVLWGDTNISNPALDR